jgi:hypothetical protein
MKNILKNDAYLNSSLFIFSAIPGPNPDTQHIIYRKGKCIKMSRRSLPRFFNKTSFKKLSKVAAEKP